MSIVHHKEELLLQNPTSCTDSSKDPDTYYTGTKPTQHLIFWEFTPGENFPACKVKLPPVEVLQVVRPTLNLQDLCIWFDFETYTGQIEGDDMEYILATTHRRKPLHSLEILGNWQELLKPCNLSFMQSSVKRLKLLGSVGLEHLENCHVGLDDLRTLVRFSSNLRELSVYFEFDQFENDYFSAEYYSKDLQEHLLMIKSHYAALTQIKTLKVLEIYSYWNVQHFDSVNFVTVDNYIDNRSLPYHQFSIYKGDHSLSWQDRISFPQSMNSRWIFLEVLGPSMEEQDDDARSLLAWLFANKRGVKFSKVSFQTVRGRGDCLSLGSPPIPHAAGLPSDLRWYGHWRWMATYDPRGDLNIASDLGWE